MGASIARFHLGRLSTGGPGYAVTSHALSRLARCS